MVQFGVFTVYIVPMNVLEQQNILHLKPCIAQLWTNQSGVCILAGTRHFLFSTMSWLAVGPSKPPNQWILEVFSPWVKAHHSSIQCLNGVCSNNFTFTTLADIVQYSEYQYIILAALLERSAEQKFSFKDSLWGIIKKN